MAVDSRIINARSVVRTRLNSESWIRTNIVSDLLEVIEEKDRIISALRKLLREKE